MSQPRTLHVYGLSLVCTCECFLRSLLLAKRRSQPSNSHLKGFSPGGGKAETLACVGRGPGPASPPFSISLSFFRKDPQKIFRNLFPFRLSGPAPPSPAHNAHRASSSTPPPLPLSRLGQGVVGEGTEEEERHRLHLCRVSIVIHSGCFPPNFPTRGQEVPLPEVS